MGKIDLKHAYAEKIIEDIEKAKKSKDKIKSLLREYSDKSERNFIQKYAETKLNDDYGKVTTIAFVTTLSFVAISLIGRSLGYIFLGYDYYKQHPLVPVIIVIVGIILIIVLLYYILDIASKDNPYKKLIVAVEEDKLPYYRLIWSGGSNLIAVKGVQCIKVNNEA